MFMYLFLFQIVLDLKKNPFRYFVLNFVRVIIFLPINNFYRVFFSRFVFTNKVTSLFKNTLQRKSENLFIYNGKTLDDKSSACECFVQKKYFSSERFFYERTHIIGLCFQRQIQEPCKI